METKKIETWAEKNEGKRKAQVVAGYPPIKLMANEKGLKTRKE